MRRIVIGLVGSLMATGAAAQTPMNSGMQMGEHAATTCPDTPPAPADAALIAATDEAGLAKATLALGAVTDLTLADTSAIHYPLRPEKPGGSVSHGGLVAITVPEAGTYRVSLSSGAWIDLVQDGKSVESTAHGPGKPCSKLRKNVEFPLKPGRYTLQIAGNGTPTITVRVGKAS